MRLATWNVNSLRVRLGHLLQWLSDNPVSAIGLQETKLTDDKFPSDEIGKAGYHVVFAGQPTYNGVALLAKKDFFAPPSDVVINNPLSASEQIRIISATLTPLHGGEPLRFINAYVPNGSEVGSEKYAFKLAWLDHFSAWIREELSRHRLLTVVGDYNIAPEDRDVHDPQLWHEKVLCSSAERERFGRLLSLGLRDSFRLFDQPGQAYSWWDYRQGAFRRNMGLRIDHLLVSEALSKLCVGAGIDAAPRSLDQPSDHAPAWADFRPI